jgi:hypothetical protein
LPFSNDEESSTEKSSTEKSSTGTSSTGILTGLFGGPKKSTTTTTTTTSDVYTGEDKLLKLLQKALTEGKDEDTLKQTNANEINKNLTELKKVKDDIIKFLTDVGKLADVTPDNIDSLLNQNLWYKFSKIEDKDREKNISQYLSMQFNEQQLDNNKLAAINNTWFKEGSFGAENNYPDVASKLKEKWMEMIRAHETNKKLKVYKTSDINDALVNQYDPNAQDFTDAMFVGLVQPNIGIQTYFPVWLKKNGYLASENLDVMPKIKKDKIEMMNWIEGDIEVIKFEYFDGTQKMIGEVAQATGQYLGDRGKEFGDYAQEKYAEAVEAATKDEGDDREINAKKRLKEELYKKFEKEGINYKNLQGDQKNNKELKMDQIHKAIVHLKVNDKNFDIQLYKVNPNGTMIYTENSDGTRVEPNENDENIWKSPTTGLHFPRIKEVDTLKETPAFVNAIKQIIEERGFNFWEGQGFFGGKNKKKTIKKRSKRKGTRRR